MVFVTGRLKEIINRGGEKIAPREVDEVLMAHPAVAQAVTFPVPHVQLGEEVAAAVVLRAEATTTVAELRAFAAIHLADFKIPRQVFLVESLPQSATGKLPYVPSLRPNALPGPRNSCSPPPSIALIWPRGTCYRPCFYTWVTRSMCSLSSLTILFLTAGL